MKNIKFTPLNPAKPEFRKKQNYLTGVNKVYKVQLEIKKLPSGSFLIHFRELYKFICPSLQGVAPILRRDYALWITILPISSQNIKLVLR